MLFHLLFMAANYIMPCCLFVLGCLIVIAFIFFHGKSGCLPCLMPCYFLQE